MINKVYFLRFIVWTDTDPCDIFYIYLRTNCALLKWQVDNDFSLEIEQSRINRILLKDPLNSKKINMA